MSSPYDPLTKKGTEETLEAISRTIEWASRINTNDVQNINISNFITLLQTEETTLRQQYQLENTSLAVENFVYNNEDCVEKILCGDLDQKVSGLQTVEEYIENEFGSEKPPDLSKEELLWLVATEVSDHQNTETGPDCYSEPPFTKTDISNMGYIPDLWAE